MTDPIYGWMVQTEEVTTTKYSNIECLHYILNNGYNHGDINVRFRS